MSSGNRFLKQLREAGSAGKNWKEQQRQLKKKRLTRIFHTDSSRGAANSDDDMEGDGLRRPLYEYIPPKSQFETNAVIMSFPQAVIDRYEICG